MRQVPSQRRACPHPGRPIAQYPNRRRHGRFERLELRVIHILYTVWGYHTTSSANGQASAFAAASLAGC
jgi:hypothetical protein